MRQNGPLTVLQSRWCTCFPIVVDSISETLIPVVWLSDQLWYCTSTAHIVVSWAGVTAFAVSVTDSAIDFDSWVWLIRDPDGHCQVPLLTRRSATAEIARVGGLYVLHDNSRSLICDWQNKFTLRLFTRIREVLPFDIFVLALSRSLHTWYDFHAISTTLHFSIYVAFRPRLYCNCSH